MGSHIEAVKNCVKQVRDDLVKQFQGCDIRFAFVRYTDYDQPENSRTTHIDFTKYVYNYNILYRGSALLLVHVLFVVDGILTLVCQGQ